MIKIQGRSYTKEFVYCALCEKRFVWLRAEPDLTKDKAGYYIAVCSACRKKFLNKKGNKTLQEVLE